MSGPIPKSRVCDLDKSQMQYVDLISYIVCEPIRVPSEMSKVLDHLYLGSYDDAVEKSKLKKEEITHIVNTVEEPHSLSTGPDFYGDEFKYFGFSADDMANYPIMDHLEDTYKFIEDARRTNGKCLIHCLAGVNRSGALTVAYVMLHRNIGPISATRLVFNARGMLLSNNGFIERLVKLAVDKKLLTKDLRNKFQISTMKMDGPFLQSKYTDLDKSQMQYVNMIAYLVCEPVHVPSKMSKVLDHLYLGSYNDALEKGGLKKKGITHIINTVEQETCTTGSDFFGDEFKYLGFPSEDVANYPIMDHFEATYKFIEDVRETGGKCLIHCMRGINRSGALTVAYVMLHHNIGPISATRLVLNARKMLLSNVGFIERLVKLAVDKDLLTKDADEVNA